MASDLGVLLPTESQYGNPAAYTEAIRAEATKQAAYLSQMDQFYASLEENKRQFDLNYAAREKEFSWTSGFQEKKLATETQLAERKLVLEEKESELMRQIKEKELQFAETQLGFQRETLGFQKEKLQAELEALRTQTGLAEKNFALQRELGLGELDVKRSQLQSQSAFQFGQLALEQEKLQAQTYLGQLDAMAKNPQAFEQKPQGGRYSYYGEIGNYRYQRDYEALNKGPAAYTPNYDVGTSAYRRLMGGYNG